MSDYRIITDSACDIAPETLAQWNVGCVDITFRFDGSDREYTNRDLPVHEFYERMRKGECARTAAANIDTFTTAFEQELQQGHDVLCLGFSSGLSTTCNAAQIAAKDLAERYPERRVVVVDTLCASAGQGLMVYLTAQQRDQGADLDTAAAYAEQIRPQLCHWFTVDDLVYLKRGGRVSAATALAGTILGIKPVLHVDDEGHLINMQKARGRKMSIRAVADQYDALAITPKEGTVFISHGDCPEDAAALDDLLQERYGLRAQLITNIGPVIGAHSGPGTLALFFLGQHR